MSEDMLTKAEIKVLKDYFASKPFEECLKASFPGILKSSKEAFSTDEIIKVFFLSTKDEIPLKSLKELVADLFGVDENGNIPKEYVLDLLKEVTQTEFDTLFELVKPPLENDKGFAKEAAVNSPITKSCKENLLINSVSSRKDAEYVGTIMENMLNESRANNQEAFVYFPKPQNK